MQWHDIPPDPVKWMRVYRCEKVTLLSTKFKKGAAENTATPLDLERNVFEKKIGMQKGPGKLLPTGL